MLIKELQNSARTLGEVLRANPSVQTYLLAQVNCAADPEAAELENRLLALYQRLLSRQQSGEALQGCEIDDFNALKRQVYQHPLIAVRDRALDPVKGLFSQTGNELSNHLGVDFTDLAQVPST